MGWANRITIGRGVLTVALWALLAASGPRPPTAIWWAAALLFLVTAVTDAVDGAIARWFGEVSVFGRIADPLVDKLLILGTLIVMLGLEGVATVLPPWIVVAILAREFVVTALRAAVEARGESFGAAASGKGKMLLQCGAVLAVMLHGAGVPWLVRELPGLDALPGPRGVWNLAHLLVWAAGLLTIASGVSYVRRAARILSRA